MNCLTTLREPLICSNRTNKTVHSFGYKILFKNISIIAFDFPFYPKISRKSTPPISTAAMDSKTAENGTGKGVPMMLTSGVSGRINVLLSLHACKALMMMLFNAMLLVLLLPFRRRKVQCLEKNGGGVKVGRRGMAIRRVVQEGEDEKEETIRKYSLFGTSRGDIMFTQSWTPVSTKVRGLVVILHGLNEHSGRYKYLAKQLNGNGLKAYAMDWIGHGGSDGLHGYVPSLDLAVSDMKSFLEKVLAENPGLPCFCFGHSTGGAIVLKAALDAKVNSSISGIVVTSPAVGVQPTHPILSALAPIFAFLLPRYQLSAANKRGMAVSRDPQALEAKYSDPLVFTGSIRVRTGYEILKITAFLQQNLRKLTVPFLVLHGTADTVTDPEASQMLHHGATSSDKSIKLYKGLLHDLLFEPEKEDILKDIIDWLNSRVQR
ncbi:phospholipase [Lithospermum erythrorhizon]|uniref:Phospholipase n=1 Tax=Lithospermum erythrorhizon TaxID=34254 RepID=A0AAV3NGI0_LITER